MEIRPVLLFAGLALLAGCATMTPEERRALDEAQCRDYGFTPGTDAFAECLQRIDLDRRAEWRARRIELDHWHEPRVVYQPVIVHDTD
ncbi:hypothetical protein [Nitratireductor sp. GCM10026969]|uniref:hypothetical protein n=1 Tax=Nitratireductor sp. GCM10026969 TaxID=3252645 RepID=UPI00361E7570